MTQQPVYVTTLVPQLWQNSIAYLEHANPWQIESVVFFNDKTNVSLYL